MEGRRTVPRVETLRDPGVTGMPSLSLGASSGRRRTGSSCPIYAPAECPVSTPLSIYTMYSEGSDTHLIHSPERLEELLRPIAEFGLDVPPQVPPREGSRFARRRAVQERERAVARAIDHNIIRRCRLFDL